MKCKACDGRGVLVASIYENDEVGFVDKTYQCCCCHGTGEIEMTNEEWRKTCSAEEFAAWLWKYFDHGEVIVLWEKYGCPMYKDDNGESRADYTEAMKKWLREIHKE